MSIQTSPARMLITLVAPLVAIVFSVSGEPLIASEPSPVDQWFPFVIPGLDVSETPTDLSWLNEVPAGRAGSLSVVDGHFVQGDGKRIRLFGTNLTATSCFPDKRVAPQLAAHFRKLGFNVIRFHFMDVGPAPTGIFSRDRTSLDAGQLDRLDLFIAKLKENGIYANLNLHVAYSYGMGEAFLQRNRAFRMGKMLDNFYPSFLAFRKSYATRLLTHRNPYTGLTYAEEPAVAAVELNNENTLLKLTPVDVAGMPTVYRNELTRQWNRYLDGIYRSNDELRASWDQGVRGVGDELLDQAQWQVQGGASSDRMLETETEYDDGSRGLRFTATKGGSEAWYLQLFHGGLTLRKGDVVRFRFAARASGNRNISIHPMLHESPWTACGQNQRIEISRRFQSFDLRFEITEESGQDVRLNINLQNQPGEYEFRDLSLRMTDVIGLPPGESLEQQNIGMPDDRYSATARRDFEQFLITTERHEVERLVHFLKSDLGVKAPISNTQASYGGIAGVHREATLSDFVDMHGYWEHPHFPRRAWDRSDWLISNTSQIRAEDGGTLAKIATHRVDGLPFTVSEYNVPAPSDYSPELFPMLSSIAALQDWDGIYQYTYSNFEPDWDAQQIRSFFDLCGHTGQLAHLPAGALIFRLGLVDATTKSAFHSIPAEVEALTTDSVFEQWRRSGTDATAIATRRLAVELSRSDKGSGQTRTFRGADPDDQIAWLPNQGTFSVNAPSVKVALGAFDEIEMGDVRVRSDGSQLSFSMVSLDAQPFETTTKILVAVVGQVQNHQMIWNADRTSVSTDWGVGPTMCRGVNLSASLPGTDWAVSRLDGTGAEVGPGRGSVVGDRYEITVSPDDKTLWYLLYRD